jgi:hypothetical protein
MERCAWSLGAGSIGNGVDYVGAALKLRGFSTGLYKCIK